MRVMAVKEWYGSSCENVESFISHFNGIIEQNADRLKTQEIFSLKPKALIVPHAGWVYSGFTANFAYAIAKNSPFKKIAVIGPSHKFAFEGASVTLEDEYQTPCGNLKIETKTARELIQMGVKNLEYVHQEHSTEVQMPFIKHYFKNPEVLELVYSRCSAEKLSKITDFLLKKGFLLVISSDLSHYYDLKTANSLDSNCLEAVLNLEKGLLAKCEACGKTGIEALIDTAKENSLTPLLVDYRTSADVSGDTSQVVGYMSAVFI